MRATISSPNASLPRMKVQISSRSLRATHDLEQCAARLGAVLMHAHDRRRGARQAEALDELLGPMFGVRADPRPGRDLARQFSAAEHQVHGKGEIGQRDHAQDPGDRDRRRPALVLGAGGQHVGEQAQHDGERMDGDARKPGVHGGCSAPSRRSTPGSRSGKILGQQSRPKFRGGRSVQPHRGRGREKGIHALRQQTQDHSPEHIAGARGRQGRRGVRIDDGAPVGRRNHGIRAFQHDHCAAQPGGRARARELVARGVEQTCELALMRREYAGSSYGCEQLPRPVREHADGVGIEQHRTAGSRASRARVRGSSR